VLEKEISIRGRIMLTKTKYEEIVLKELRAFPDEAIPHVIHILQSVRKGICITQKAITIKNEPSGLCGTWKDDRSSGEIIEDIRSHRTGFGKRQIYL
jgi:hypothetical protein